MNLNPDQIRALGLETVGILDQSPMTFLGILAVQGPPVEVFPGLPRSFPSRHSFVKGPGQFASIMPADGETYHDLAERVLITDQHEINQRIIDLLGLPLLYEPSDGSPQLVALTRFNGFSVKSPGFMRWTIQSRRDSAEIHTVYRAINELRDTYVAGAIRMGDNKRLALARFSAYNYIQHAANSVPNGRLPGFGQNVGV